eukprot:TRINITY_DN3227_c0_g1_i2.p2 TRINITY_DN3227_c0_g1~~TRINITY_DN3227_c0_g1_i2.p2  ORF type:complete len:104 (+),score=59.85 TRINITY_DN3227_c0_g1_i2:184-495(+)
MCIRDRYWGEYDYGCGFDDWVTIDLAEEEWGCDWGCDDAVEDQEIEEEACEIEEEEACEIEEEACEIDEIEAEDDLSLIHISEPTRLLSISYAVFCLKKKKKI